MESYIPPTRIVNITNRPDGLYHIPLNDIVSQSSINQKSLSSGQIAISHTLLFFCIYISTYVSEISPNVTVHCVVVVVVVVAHKWAGKE